MHVNPLFYISKSILMYELITVMILMLSFAIDFLIIISFMYTLIPVLSAKDNCSHLFVCLVILRPSQPIMGMLNRSAKLHLLLESAERRE